MPVYLLDETEPSFPHPSLAASGGLLAVGGALTPEWLVLAYRNGIFPWFEAGGAYYWYTPDPRCVLFPRDLKVHKSMRSIFNQQKFTYTLDTCFEQVIRACARAPRPGQEEDGTWISESFVEGYGRLHDLGIAHSVEVWEDGILAGGLYGISLGKIFYGESMFSRVPNASKAGFITLVRALEATGFSLVDCQQDTPYLRSLGATLISRESFGEYLQRNQFEKTLIGPWTLSNNGQIGLRNA